MAVSQSANSMNKKTQAIDFSLWFMPQSLTALSFTAEYERLNESQRLRYNQLQGLYLNEQTMFFEKALAPALAYFLKSTFISAGLRERVREFAKEEHRHTVMFRELNRRAGGIIYEQSDFHFVRITPAAKRLLHFIAGRPRLFPFVLWLMHLQEERALYFGRQFTQCEHPIEPSFLETQRIHMADEAHHVSCDKDLLDWVWPRTTLFVRYINVRLLAWLMREFFGPPKRAQILIVSRLADELPELQPRLPVLKRALLALGSDQRFLCSMYSRENVPEAFSRFDRTPELWPLARVLPGYEPQVSA
jgi:hypothetical protein